MGQTKGTPVFIGQGVKWEIVVVLLPGRGGNDKSLLAKRGPVLCQVMLNRRRTCLMGPDVKEDGSNIALHYCG